MSFYLDAFLFFAVGVALFLISASVRSSYWPSWGNRHTLLLGAFVTILFSSMSVLLYLDDNGTSPVYIFLKIILQIQDPNGGYTMLHTNATGLTKADMPWPFVVILFALYPAWVYVGFRTAANLAIGGKLSKPTEQVVNKRALPIFGLSLGGLFIIFGLVRFPGVLLRQSNLFAFLMTMFGIGLVILSTYWVIASLIENNKRN